MWAFSTIFQSHGRKNSNREWNWSVSGSLLSKAVLLEWIDQSFVFSHFHPYSNLYISKSQGTYNQLFSFSPSLLTLFPGQLVACLWWLCFRWSLQEKIRPILFGKCRIEKCRLCTPIWQAVCLILWKIFMLVLIYIERKLRGQTTFLDKHAM